jgi:hypothetical protein
MRFPLALAFFLVSFAVTGLPFSYLGSHNSSLSVAAQEPSPTPSSTPTPTPDAEIEKANRDKTLADANKAKAEADKAAAEAKKAQAEAEQATLATQIATQKAKLGIGVASPTATPPTGNISGSKDKFIETQLLAEMAARKLSHNLKARLCKDGSVLFAKPIRTLVINNPTDRATVISYQAILTQLKFLVKEYDRLIQDARDARDPQKVPVKADPVCPAVEFAPAALPLIVPAGTEAVKNFADLINLFRTETEFTDQTVTIDVRMIATFLAGDLAQKADRCQVEAIYYPSIYPLAIADDADSGALIKAYGDILQRVSLGDSEVSESNKEIAALTKQMEKLDELIADLKKQIEEKKKEKKPPVKPTAAGTKKAQSPKPPEPAKDPCDNPETKLAQAEADKLVINHALDILKRTAANIDAFKASIADVLKLLTTVDSGNTVIASLLRAERLRSILAADDTYSLDLSVRASGTNRIRKNMFFNAKVDHSGGVSVGANLFNNKDQMVFARLEEFYIEYMNSKEIRKRTGFQQLDSSFTK